MVTRPGGPEVLAWTDVPDPVPGPAEVLIDVAAAGVNRADLMQRLGRYAPPAGASPILGLECSGTVRAIGAQAADGPLSVGDRVCALLAGGGYAEQVAVPVGQVLPVPAGVTLADAAALPEVACTVWSNLVMTAGLRAGQTVLIHGGSSGIGTMAIQVAVALGARPIVTASTPAKLDACRRLGADVAINYRDEDFVAAVSAATDGRGADVILDVVGAPYLQRNVAAVADGGRIVVVGLLGGAHAEIDLAALMARRAGIISTQLRTRRATGPGSKAEIVAAVRQRLWPLVATGAVRPVIGRRLDMVAAAQAHRLMHAGDVIGKIVLETTGGTTEGEQP